MNIALLLQMAADADSQRIGVVCKDRSWSYGQILSAARGAAALLSESKCTHIALLDESSEAAPIALFGAALAGIPYVRLSYRLADEDLAALLGRIAPACVIGDVERALRLDPTGGHDCYHRDEFIAAANAVEETSAVEEQEGEGIAAQIFTSGTTATPKAALLRHANLLG